MVLLNGIKVAKGIFPNGEIKYINAKDYVRDENHFTLVFECNEDLFDLAIMKKAVEDCGLSVNILEMPFCPYGQMDRQMGNDLSAFKFFAKFINDLWFDRVIIYDPHSIVMENSLDRCIARYPMRDVDISNYDLIFYPDNGAEKKYSAIYEGVPYRFGNKKRNLDTGKIIKYEVIADKTDIEGKSILVRDDLINGGLTFKEAAKVLREMGAARLDIYLTHLMYVSKDFIINHKEYGYDNVYSDNTLNMPFFEKPRFLQALKEDYKNE